MQNAKESALSFQSLYKAPYLMGIEHSKSYKKRVQEAAKIMQQIYGKNGEQVKQQSSQGESKKSQLQIQWDHNKSEKSGKICLNVDCKHSIADLTQLPTKLHNFKIKKQCNQYKFLRQRLLNKGDEIQAFVPIEKSIVLSKGIKIQLQKGLDIRVIQAHHLKQPETIQQLIYLNKVNIVQNIEQVKLGLLLKKNKYILDKNKVTYLQKKDEKDKSTLPIPSLNQSTVLSVQFKDQKYWCLTVENSESKPCAILNYDTETQLCGKKVCVWYKYQQKTGKLTFQRI